MDEASFDIDSARLAQTAQRFPAQRLPQTAPEPTFDVKQLAQSEGADFARHAWDEAGTL